MAHSFPCLDKPSQGCSRVTFSSVPISCSIGIAFYPVDGASYRDLVKVADARVYRAKQAGKHTIVYQDEEA